MISLALRGGAFAAALLVASCGLTAVGTAVDTSATRDTTAQAVALVSQYRRAHGLPPVQADSKLTAAARHQASVVARAGALSHDAGSSFASRMAAYGIKGVAAENLSMGPGAAEDIVARWKASPGHNANLLHPRVNRVGMAQDGRYWALVLAQ